MKYEVASQAGKSGYNAICPDRKCGHKEFGTTKGAARRKVAEHDKQVHKPVRDAAEQKKRDDRQEKRDERTAARDARKTGGVAIKSGRRWEVITDPNDGRLNRKQKAKLLDQRKDEMKAASSAASSALRKRIEETPVGSLPKINGLHTKGLERYGIRDGQNINGVVYDKHGNPVPYDVMSRFIPGRD